MNRFRFLQALWLPIGGVLLVGCSGDARPLEEAVEASRLGLVALSIVPPANTLDDHLTIATDQQASFTLTGEDVNGASLEIDGTDRRWSVSAPGIVAIDENGSITGITEGSVEIGVRLGGVQAPAYTVVVSDAALAGIDSIQGAETLSRCVPQSYAAIGLYDDGSRRVVPQAVWALDSEINASLQNALGGTIEVNATESTTLTLSVNSGSATASTVLTVSDTLSSLVITPLSASIDVDGTVQLSATGQYAATATDGTTDTDSANLTGIDITDNVDWQVIDGSAVASVSNAGISRGLVLGLDDGSATIEAACGSTTARRVVDVTADTISAISLSESALTLLVGETYNLEVSSGSTYDADNLLTDSASWSSSNSSILTVGNDTDNKGLLTTSGSTGSVTITVSYTNSEGTTLTDSLTVTVQ